MILDGFSLGFAEALFPIVKDPPLSATILMRRLEPGIKNSSVEGFVI